MDPSQMRREIAKDMEELRAGTRPRDPVRASLYDERQRRNQGLPPRDPVRRELARDLEEMKAGTRPRDPVRARLFDEAQARAQERAAEAPTHLGAVAAQHELESAQAAVSLASAALGFLGSLARRR